MAMAQPATVTEPSRNSPLVVKTLTRDMVRAFLEATGKPVVPCLCA